MSVALCGWCLAVALSACAGSSGASGGPGAREAGAAAAAPRLVVLAEAQLDVPKVRVQLTAVRRSGPEAVIVTFRISNPDATSRVALGASFATAAADVDSVADVFLFDESHQKKYFVLRDAQDRAACSQGIGEIAPGGQRVLWARFSGPPTGVTRVTVQVPRLVPFRNIPIS